MREEVMRMRLKGANASEKCWVFDGFCLFSGEFETPSKMGMVANQLFVAPYLCLYMDWICGVGDRLDQRKRSVYFSPEMIPS